MRLRLVDRVVPSPEARVLDVATGPGYVALGFAARCRKVVGLGLTAAPLAVAQQISRERGLSNVTFQRGDAENLPFEDGEFDVVVCRYASHHFGDPLRVLSEMARVCRLNGTVALEDLVVSERPERASYQNRFENLRDPSHARAYPLSEILKLFATTNLEVENVSMDSLIQSVERWLSNAQTPPDRASEARELTERDGFLHFVQRTATIVGRRTASYPQSPHA